MEKYEKKFPENAIFYGATRGHRNIYNFFTPTNMLRREREYVHAVITLIIHRNQGWVTHPSTISQ